MLADRSRYKAVLFDLDGTLLDTLDDLADSTNCVLRRLGFPEHPREAYKYFVGDGVEALIQRAIPRQVVDRQAIADYAQMMRQEYSLRWAEKTRPYDGIAELLDGLTNRGLPRAVLSNKPAEFTRLCVSRLLARWQFEVVLGAGAELPRKPHPAAALAIAARLGLPPQKIVYLGDTNTDMQTALAAGMYPVGAVWGFRTAAELTAAGARRLIERPPDLLRLWDPPGIAEPG
jgi:phosphoglycolate phosphatase